MDNHRIDQSPHLRPYQLRLTLPVPDSEEDATCKSLVLIGILIDVILIKTLFSCLITTVVCGSR